MCVVTTVNLAGGVRGLESATLDMFQVRSVELWRPKRSILNCLTVKAEFFGTVNVFQESGGGITPRLLSNARTQTLVRPYVAKLSLQKTKVSESDAFLLLIRLHPPTSDANMRN